MFPNQIIARSFSYPLYSYLLFLTEDYKTLTTYKYYKCSKEQKKVLKQAAHDAINIAYAGISFFYGPGGDTVEYMNFDKEAAIDFFGPLSKIQKKKNRFEEIKKLKRKIYSECNPIKFGQCLRYSQPL